MSRLPKVFSSPSIASTSQEGQGAVERSTLCVTLLSREWRSSFDGDLSTVNRELAIQLAKHPGVQVSVFLPQCSEDDKRIAANHRVKLIEVEEMTVVDPVDWLINIPEDHVMDCIIGHGVHLGRQIPLIQQSHQCKWIQIVHNAHEALAMYKSSVGAIPRGEQMQQTEIELCELADQVVAIGPKLAETYRRFLRSSEKHQDVIDLTPSIFTEFLDVKQASKERKTFCVLVIGSGDSEDFTLKGYDLAARAIAELKENSYQLKFVCAPRGRGDEIAEKLLKHGIDRSQLIVRSFNESRETLARLFCEVDLAIMPSRSEGFGLTALEALSAGLPVLVSGNSGLGEALMKVPNGSNCVVDSEDPKLWASKIRAVREKDRDVRLAESNYLREKYLEKYSWQEACGILVEKMQNLVTGSCSHSGLPSSLEHYQPPFPAGAQTPAQTYQTSHTQSSSGQGIPPSSLEHSRPPFPAGTQTPAQTYQTSHPQSSGYWPSSMEYCRIPSTLAGKTHEGPSYQTWHSPKGYSQLPFHAATQTRGEPTYPGSHHPQSSFGWLPSSMEYGQWPSTVANQTYEGPEYQRIYSQSFPVQGRPPFSVEHSQLPFPACSQAPVQTSQTQSHHPHGSSVQGWMGQIQSSFAACCQTPVQTHQTSHTQKPFNLEKCQQQLQSIYNTMSKVKIIPWDESSAIHIDDIYTTLSWVRDDRKPSGVTQEELKDYTDIFKGDKHHPNPKRLLVYGRPGIGKTTFSKKTAFDWSRQRKEILKKFDVVLLIKLRDVCDLRDIRDVLRASKLLAGVEVVSVHDVYEYLLHNQEKVLLILDGYDEYFCSGEKSPVRDIWEGTELRNIHVIITTRQEKANELRFPSDVQFEINGFKSDNQVRAFVSKVLGDDKKLDEFVTYLEERALKDLAEIPLLLLMLCTIWKESHFRELPKSRAHICQNFVLTLIHHAITKEAKAEEEEDINVLELYNTELCALGKLAFDALLQNALSFPFGKLPDSILSDRLIKFGLFHVLNAATFLRREKHVYFIHKSVQEYLAAFFLKEELLKEASTSCLSEVDSFEKVVKMIEVLRFACELSADAACAVLSHLGIVGKKEGLTEYNFTETPCIEDLSKDQEQILTHISHSFFSCSAEKRRDLYPMFLSHVGGVLFIDSDQLHSLANEHFLKSAAAPEFIFFRSGLHTQQSYQDLISVLEDLRAVVVCCSGEKKASDVLKKYSLSSVGVFLKKEEEKIYLYIAEIETGRTTLPTEMLTELISSPESTQKKPVDDQSNEQDDSSALCLTENSTDDTQATHHCLSFVWIIYASVNERQDIETLIDVLPFVTSPRHIIILDGGSATDPVLVDTLVSRINFTNRLLMLTLQNINLTAKPAALIARSLYQAPNLTWLNLSHNPLGEGVSDVTRHLSCAPHLDTLHLSGVKMTKKQVNDLTEAVRQTKISWLFTSYHDEEGNLKPEHEWPSEDYWMDRPWADPGRFAKPEDERELGASESEDELETGASESEDELKTGASESEDELETGASELEDELETGASESEDVHGPGD